MLCSVSSVQDTETTSSRVYVMNSCHDPLEHISMLTFDVVVIPGILFVALIYNVDSILSPACILPRHHIRHIIYLVHTV